MQLNLDSAVQESSWKRGFRYAQFTDTSVGAQYAKGIKYEVVEVGLIIKESVRKSIRTGMVCL